MPEYGEPWGYAKYHDDFDYRLQFDRRVQHGGWWSDEYDQMLRAIACVNAMVGLDPVKVRELIDELAGAGCCGGTKHMMEVPCGECRSCRARACREDAG